jgi:hypothetical protein
MTMIIKETTNTMIIKIFVLVFILLGAFTTKAQNLQYEVEISPNETAMNVFDTAYTHQCVLILPDTSNIDSIHVCIGSSLNSQDIMNHKIGFDQMTLLPIDITYIRRKEKVYLGLGNHSKGDFFYKIVVSDTMNLDSQPVHWNNVNL